MSNLQKKFIKIQYLNFDNRPFSIVFIILIDLIKNDLITKINFYISFFKAES